MSPVAGVEDKDKVACQGCGKQIVWGAFLEDGDGKTPGREKRVPLDPSAPCYRVMDRHPKGHLVIERDREVAVSHFKTCPKASLFSKAVKPEERSALADAVPEIGDKVEVVDGPFGGLVGYLSRKAAYGEGVDPKHRHFLDWWLTVTSETGDHVGVCFVGSAQVKVVEKGEAHAS